MSQKKVIKLVGFNIYQKNKNISKLKNLLT